MNLTELQAKELHNWDDISAVLDALADQHNPPQITAEQLMKFDIPGIAFITFAYDIDGVSIEIAKYAQCLEQLIGEKSKHTTIHCVGGNFAEKADFVLEPRWQRKQLPHADGWDKWQQGKWFSRLFYEDMPENSDTSAEVAREIWQQAVTLTQHMCDYIQEHNIGLLIPVNVNSNPGNLAYALAIVLTSEVLSVPVINNNHDFYWEGGTPFSERADEHIPGPRDHFFHNENNQSFFQCFERIIPWNGKHWIQVNINPMQTQWMTKDHQFKPDDVFEIGTLIEDAFFEPCTGEEKRMHRWRMAHILSDGFPIVTTVSVDEHLKNLGSWMNNQRPIMCGIASDLKVDIASPDSFYVLQPTRIVERKRIERDWELLDAVLHHPRFRDIFEEFALMTLTLHITGPVPIEHQADLEKVLHTYRDVVSNLPEDIARRVFVAFSVGTEDHPSLHENDMGKLNIVSIYQLADMVLFPSLTEGRGLPILESAAAGVPIVCSRYQPEDVFAAVVGEHLPESEQVIYDLFPEGEFSEEFVEQVADLLLKPFDREERTEHNRAAVRNRYSMDAMVKNFGTYISRLADKT